MTIKVKIPERRPSAVRLRAQLRGALPSTPEEATRPAHGGVTPAARPLPDLPPISLGQALRASLLVLLGFGALQLPQGDRARAEKPLAVASLPAVK